MYRVGVMLMLRHSLSC